MPDDQAQELDVVQHPTLGELKFPKDMPFEERNASIKRLESNTLTQKTQAAAHAAGAPTGPEPMPRGFEPKKQGEVDLANPIMAAGARLDRLGGLQNRAMRSPTPVTSAVPFIYPAAQLAEAVASGGLRKVATEIGRGTLKAAAGSTVGAGVGAGVGSIVGHPKEGAQIGATVGGIAAPFVPGRTFARLPYGAGRMIASDEEYAAALASRKLAQRNADLTVGLRKPPDELTLAVREGRAARLPTRLALPTVEPPVDELAQAIKEGRAARLPVRMPPPKPEVDELTQAVREGRAARLPARMPRPKLEAPLAPSPLAGMASSAPGEVATLPPLTLGRGTPPAPANVKFVSRFKAPTQAQPLVISTEEPQFTPNDLISRTRRVSIPGEEPTPTDLKRAGDLTQAPLERLKALAKFGDKLAQNELRRRLKH